MIDVGIELADSLGMVRRPENRVGKKVLSCTKGKCRVVVFPVVGNTPYACLLSFIPGFVYLGISTPLFLCRTRDRYVPAKTTWVGTWD